MMLLEVSERIGAWVSNGVQDLESYIGNFQHGCKTLMLWSDLVEIDMGGTIGSIAFVSFPKETIIEGNQNGIGLRKIVCV